MKKLPDELAETIPIRPIETLRDLRDVILDVFPAQSVHPELGLVRKNDVLIYLDSLIDGTYPVIAGEAPAPVADVWIEPDAVKAIVPAADAPFADLFLAIGAAYVRIGTSEAPDELADRIGAAKRAQVEFVAVSSETGGVS